MKISLTINLTATEARKLWRAQEDNTGTPPKGEALAEWVAGFATNTIESNWEYDAMVYADVKARGEV
jgi:hypothetical protein